ncbi:probable palmitoyltransferase ZDHHC12 isoform X1 [Phalaenopsis equestris]|uniref:probable palmitoyltransferase ZDHHC12 isoform X1 n=1 Tax=Phalaenopsis equestris TaxID=78828 RepID=UPI0009E531F1|nr:probable palmitoyltransferase ZDHHC12 isoform X1 [Phalaenopsis equestris]
MIGLRLILSAKPQWAELRAKLVSLVVVLLSHVALAMVPRLFSFLSLLAVLPIAALVMVSTYAFAAWLRRLLHMRASAPAMVISHILFIWGVHITVVRVAIPSLLDAALNMECVLLLIGLYRISYGDPGIVAIKSTCSGALGQTDISEFPNEGFPLLLRVRYCYFCKRNVKGFDHHCAAFGNCIGQNNHHLFMVLVIGFIITEATFTMCSSQYIKVLSRGQSFGFERNIAGNLVISTLLFSFLQVLWQVPFLIWHLYCICCNIKTDEWVNWSKYPEFQLVAHSPQESSFTVMRFVNPYNQGILSNVREYLTSS